MARAADPRAMAPREPGRTRTAPPRMPAQFPFRGRFLPYVLFDASGLIYLLLGLLALRVVWALGTGPSAFEAVLASFDHPLYVLFHLLSLAAVVFVGVRFFSLFPKAQPPKIGPVKPPPGPVILGMLYTAWIGITVLFVAVLAGGIFG